MAQRASGKKTQAGRSGSSTNRQTSSKRTGSASKRRSASSSRSSSSSRSGAGARASAGRSDKSVQAFREAVERSRSALSENVTIPPDRLREVVDDAVKRGRMTRGDANDLVSKLVTRGRKQADDLIGELERLLEQARRGVDTRTASTRRQASRAAERVGRGVRDVADRPLAEADKLRRRTGVGAPITAYDQLTVPQIKSRLVDLSAAELRKVRTQERKGKARKGVLDTIEKQLERG